MNTIATTSSVTPSTPNPKQPQQRQTAKEIITANVKELIAQLETGHSNALTAYLDAMSRFHNYSFGNVLEIARQKPGATRVAGLYAWNQLGRKVKKGEKGIRCRDSIHHRNNEKAQNDTEMPFVKLTEGQLPKKPIRFAFLDYSIATDRKNWEIQKGEIVRRGK